MTYVIKSKVIPDKDVPGLTWHVQLEPDESLNAMGEPEGDGYTPAQVAAFRAGDWEYVIVVVTPRLAGLDLDRFRQVLGGVEHGRVTLTDEDDNVTGIRMIDLDYMIAGMPDDDPGYPVPEMIAEARADMAAKLPALAADLKAAGQAIKRAERKR